MFKSLFSNLPLPFIVIAAIVVLIFVAKIIRPSRRGASSSERPRAKKPLTVHEQKMFFRLQQTFPELIVLSQVSLSALLAAKSWQARNTFNRKFADFVLCDKSFTPLAVIELDDATHDGREIRDDNRDALLEGAGYKVLRFRGIPDAAALLAALRPPAPETPASTLAAIAPSPNKARSAPVERIEPTVDQAAQG